MLRNDVAVVACNVDFEHRVRFFAIVAAAPHPHSRHCGVWSTDCVVVSAGGRRHAVDSARDLCHFVLFADVRGSDNDHIRLPHCATRRSQVHFLWLIVSQVRHHNGVVLVAAAGWHLGYVPYAAPSPVAIPNVSFFCACCSLKALAHAPSVWSNLIEWLLTFTVVCYNLTFAADFRDRAFVACDFAEQPSAVAPSTRGVAHLLLQQEQPRVCAPTINGTPYRDQMMLVL